MRAAKGWRPIVAVAIVAAMLAAGAAGVAVAGTQPVTLPGTHPADPAVSGSRVVWADDTYGYYDIFCYDAATGVTRRLTFGGSDHVQPAISGDTVVWADYRAGDADIWGMDLATGVEQPIVVAADDQIHPSISGTRLAWEDYRNGYNPAVRVRDLATGSEIVLASGYNMPAKRPRISGDVVVWEDYAAQALGRTDPDVKAYDFTTGYITVADSARSEMLPATDGRYIVWAESNGRDLDVRALDTRTGRTRTIGSGAAEQTFPQVADGVAYWLDNSAGKRTSLVTYTFASGRLARFGDYGTSDVGALAAEGGSVAWLAKTGADWKVRVAVPRATVATSRLARLLPARPVPLVCPVASAAAAPAPLAVVGTSVRRGALDVPRGSTFSVYFSKPLDPASVTGSAVRVLDPSGRPVRGRVRYSALAHAAVFTPASPLGAGTYTLSVSPTLADTAGSRMAAGTQVSFSTIHILSDTIPPSAPPSIVASVAGTGSVALSWGASTDNVGVTGYDIYRSTMATAIANFPTDASLTLSVGAVTTATVPVKADEAAKSYCYYYVVVAVDAAGNPSAPSYNGCPDPHGTYTANRSTNLCMRCHSVHGAKPQLALGAKTAAACYVCHGNTPDTGTFGAASTFDTQGDFGDDTAIATTGPELASGASIHRNAYMVSIQRECDSCHSPHKRPFNYDPTISYRRLLRTQVSTGTPASYDYSTDAVPSGNRFCADCHGASLTNIGIVGGSTAYSDTGGDHTSNYGLSAHSPSSVPSNSGDTNPGIQCEACHNNHGSATNKLIDYRASGTTTTANNQSGLCFRCHSASGLEAGKPNTWNGRDVRVEFQRVSHHPYTAPVGSPPVLSATWLQTLQADFLADGLTNTTATAGDSVELASANNGKAAQVFFDGFETNNFTNWDAAPTYWQTSNADKNTGTYSARGYATSTTRRTDYLVKTISLTGRTNAQLSYAYKTVAFSATDTFTVEYSIDGGASWVSLFTTSSANVPWTTKTHALPSTANRVRFTSSIANINRYVYLDDVSVTADAIPSGYISAGTAQSTLIVPAQGNVCGWGTLTVDGAEPVGTTMTVDVLDGSDGSPLAGYSGIRFSGSPLVIPLAPIDPIAYPTLMVRASLAGNASAPRVLADTFGASKVDTSTWTDALVGGGTDPDAAGTLNLKTITFATALIDANSGVDTYTPTVNNQWNRNSTSGGGANGTTGYARCPLNSTAASHTITENLGDLTGYSSVNLSYWYRDGGTLAANERMLVEWSTNGGASWTALRTHSSGVNDPGTVFGQFTNAGLGTGSNCMLRFTANITNSSDNVRLDEIVIDGVRAATDLWPAEGKRLPDAEGVRHRLRRHGGHGRVHVGLGHVARGGLRRPLERDQLDRQQPGWLGRRTEGWHHGADRHDDRHRQRRQRRQRRHVPDVRRQQRGRVPVPRDGGREHHRRGVGERGHPARMGPARSRRKQAHRLHVAGRQHVDAGRHGQPDDGVDRARRCGAHAAPRRDPLLDGELRSLQRDRGRDHQQPVAQARRLDHDVPVPAAAGRVDGRHRPGVGADDAGRLQHRRDQPDHGGRHGRGRRGDARHDDRHVQPAIADAALRPSRRRRELRPVRPKHRDVGLDELRPAGLQQRSRHGPGVGRLGVHVQRRLLHDPGRRRDHAVVVQPAGRLRSRRVAGEPDRPAQQHRRRAGTRPSTPPRRACTTLAVAGSPAIMWWDTVTTTSNGFNFSTGSSTSLGAGSAMAYAPAAARLFVINRNGGTGNGNLYYRANPAKATNTVAFSSVSQVTPSSGTTYYNRMTVANTVSGEYLFILGRSQSLNATGDLQVVSNLTAATPSVASIAKFPWNSALADGCDLEWDGGQYLYAIRGGGSTSFARIQIPDDPTVPANWGAWEQLSGPASGTFSAGSAISFAIADGGQYTGPGYFGTGSVTTGDIRPATGAYRWGMLTFGTDLPEDTTVTVTVQGWDGSTWVNLLGTDSGSADLSGYTTSAYSKLRLVGNLSSADPNFTPALDDWGVTSARRVWTTTGSLSCVNCHNTHNVQKGTGVWYPARVSDPANTKTVWAGASTDFCLTCHDGTPPGQTIGAAVNVPYSVSFHDIGAAPFFFGWNKSQSGFEFKSSGHFTTAGTKALCENCHDPHGSNNKRLVAWTRPSSFTVGIAGDRDNTGSGAAESNLCLQCHGNSGVAIGGFTGRTATGSAGVRMDIATPLSLLRAHPTTSTGIHSDLEGPATLGAGYRHAECVDCHDPHAARQGVHATGTAEAGQVLRGAWGEQPTWGNTAQMSAPTTYTTVRIDGSAGSYESYLCFKCHSSAVNLSGVKSPSGNFQETNIAAEFNPANASGHNVAGDSFTKLVAGPGTWTWGKPTTSSLGLSGAWTADSSMTCSDCHSYNSATGSRGPHGSANTFMLKYGSTANWWSTSLNNWSSASNMCNKCHTSDPHGNWEGEDEGHYIACEGCHIRIPHGWKRPRLLARHGNAAIDNLPYVDPNVRGNTGIAGSWSSSNSAPNDKDSCFTNCGEHNSSGTSW